MIDWNAISQFPVRLLTLLRQSVRTFFVLLIRGYQFFISPYFPTSCRYHPTCSHYAIEAIKTHGAIRGVGLTAWRILRCNPWSAGGEDPVPAKKEKCCGDHHTNLRDARPSATLPSTTSNDLLN